jgi:hypothetical protein
MGAQWDRAGGCAWVPRIADLALLVMQTTSAFLRVGSCSSHLGALLDHNSFSTLLSSRFISSLICLATLACNTPHSSSHHHLNTTSTSKTT